VEWGDKPTSQRSGKHTAEARKGTKAESGSGVISQPPRGATSLRILYPAKLSFKIDGAIKIFHYKQKIKEYKTTEPPLQKIL
jgi:hypothetical protein